MCLHRAFPVVVVGEKQKRRALRVNNIIEIKLPSSSYARYNKRRYVFYTIVSRGFSLFPVGFTHCVMFGRPAAVRRIVARPMKNTSTLRRRTLPTPRRPLRYGVRDAIIKYIEFQTKTHQNFIWKHLCRAPVVFSRATNPFATCFIIILLLLRKLFFVLLSQYTQWTRATR